MLAFILQSGAVLALILANGFFVAAEMAVVTSRKARLAWMAAQGSSGARAALELSGKPEHFLATVQIGITLLTILSGAYGEASLAHHAQTLLREVPPLAPYAQPLGFGLTVAAITLTTLVFGELVPKRLAIARPEATAAGLSRPVAALLRLTAPLSSLLSAATRLVLRAMGVNGEAAAHVTEEELRLLVRQAATAGVLEEAERDMVERVLRLGDRPVGTLMTHRSRIVFLDLEHPERITETIRATPFNRFPVVRGGLENLLGVAEAKDLLAVGVRQSAEEISSILVQPPHVPETATTFRLMEQLKDAGQSMAIVVDEFGDVQGLVTFTDVLLAVVGDLALTESGRGQRIAVRKDGSWLIDGLTPVSEVFALLGENVPAGEFQTLAGFVLHRLGHIPAVAERFEHGGHSYEVADMDGRRVDRVLVQKLPSPPGKA